ncbi:MAG: cobalt-precorrin-6A synthase, partial [Deltaproteobacteria bacterium]|nr:cobalt-precorrin-6A synthase [Deltaproteobacteria bacterium]
LASANTARHALEILWERNALDVIEGAARIALERSLLLVERELSVRLLLFNYDGSLLADVSH